MTKPELLLPAGNIEHLHAALESGADAVYLGLKQFNARGRAANFSLSDLNNAVHLFHQQGKKVFVTLNTVVKNIEIQEINDLLNVLHTINPDALIIQDIGMYRLIRKGAYKTLSLHGSTQMGFHNSLGVSYAAQLGFERVILSRELTKTELEQIVSQRLLALEVFVHGALCYSFSGMCLFSSYLGGMGANRGLCTQPCRRKYIVDGFSGYFFNLKDNQLIREVPELVKMGVSTFKVEGRMRSAEYVYNTGRAYRLAIDHPERIEEAVELLRYDMGREKTSWFMGGNVSKSLADTSVTGIPAGKVSHTDEKHIYIIGSTINLSAGNRLWIISSDGQRRIALKIKDIEQTKDFTILSKPFDAEVFKDDSVYLANLRERQFQTKFNDEIPLVLPKTNIHKIPPVIFDSKPKNKFQETLFVRISSISWLRKLWIDDISAIILNFSLQEWDLFDEKSPFVQKNVARFIVELPTFIPELAIGKYQALIQRLSSAGIHQFMAGHLSQISLFPKEAKIYASENILVFNDHAAKMLQERGFRQWVYPYENEMSNLLAGTDRSGIVALHYHPKLFYSRMPVKIETGKTFQEQYDNTSFIKHVVDGITIIVPTIAVNLFVNKRALKRAGFSDFLIDLSFENPSKNLYKRIINKYQFAEQLQPSVTFNFKKGMK